MSELKKFGEFDLKMYLPDFLDNQSKDFLISVIYKL